MLEIVQTDATNIDFQNLVQELDKDLSKVDGDLHDFYHQYNGIQSIKYAVVVYDNKVPVGCGAIKKYDDNTMEIKRMYVIDSSRNKGVATAILGVLESWSRYLGCNRCVLETGKMQVEALKLYEKFGYKVIPNYGQYEGIENSICFEKLLVS